MRSFILPFTVSLVAIGHTAWAAPAPEWAVSECQGLRAIADVVHQWIDRQRPDGSFGFGLDDDCEFYKLWPIFVYAADDQRVLESLRRAMDWIWYNDAVQDGYKAESRDCQHAAEVTAYSHPLMTLIDYGNPIVIERFMETSKNIEQWTAVNSMGHRHFRSNWFGSQDMREYAYYGSDAGIVGRAVVPMMHLLWYNRDPDLARYFIEWGRAWVDHARETNYGKPYGVLPGEVVFATDEMSGFTKRWDENAVSPFKGGIRLYEVLLVDYMITGDAAFLMPSREALWLESNGGGTPTSYLLQMYRGVTGDEQFDRFFGGPPVAPTRQLALETGTQAVEIGRQEMEKVKAINIRSSVANYEAQLDNKVLGWAYPELYHGTNNWPAKDYVDLSFPAVRWRNGNYELGVVLLRHGRERFKALCCNTGKAGRRFGAQLFELEPGTYRLTLGIDENSDDVPERPLRDEMLRVERGTNVWMELEPGHEYIVELQQVAKGPAWTSRADVAVCSRDLFAEPAGLEPGSEATLRVQVHNIGTEDASEVVVYAEELGSGQVIGERAVALLPRARHMVPSRAMVQMPWKVGPQAKGVRVIVDGGGFIEELYEGNNTAEIALADIPAGPRAKRRIFIPEWWRQAQLGPVAKYTAVYVDGIQIDGKLDDAGWSKAERRGPLKDLQGNENQKQTFVRIAYGPDAIYFSVEAMEPEMDAICDRATQHDSSHVFNGDSVEIFIDANFDKETYCQFCFSASGVTAEGQYYNFTLYNPPWECKTIKGADRWTGEVRIPYASLKATARPGKTWGINVYRNTMSFHMPESEDARREGWKDHERNALSPTYGDYHLPGRFAEVTFAPKP